MYLKFISQPFFIPVMIRCPASRCFRWRYRFMSNIRKKQQCWTDYYYECTAKTAVIESILGHELSITCITKHTRKTFSKNERGRTFCSNYWLKYDSGSPLWSINAFSEADAAGSPKLIPEFFLELAIYRRLWKSTTFESYLFHLMSVPSLQSWGGGHHFF